MRPQADGATRSHWAVHRDDLTTADLLIRAGARANVANDLGVTPLYLGLHESQRGYGQEKLLTAGANPNATLLRGQTVLMECARTGDMRSRDGTARRRRSGECQRVDQRSDGADVGGGPAASARRPGADRSSVPIFVLARAPTRRMLKPATGEAAETSRLFFGEAARRCCLRREWATSSPRSCCSRPART